MKRNTKIIFGLAALTALAVIIYLNKKEADRINELKKNIDYFNSLTSKSKKIIASHSAIHCKLVKGNDKVDELEKKLAENNIYAKAIKSPTVKEGKERIRICLHAFNTSYEIKKLAKLIK